ncbi:A/G-specific adenine glycosylase [Sediminicola luteus]|uniref:Adenine DNA glycosylase n=1 Tax=Sediminicola luteus TaxID=319238 RepID=A0A2A4G4Y6_9FLAO|nr:A/G-specific adenine glycosylase [Sediminicola luteus]PCE62802.1 A/G-specific adenine glycosylase [Sediminicola luteus]
MRPTPFSTQIQSWYDKNKRDLPWRNTNDPYKIWLSEIILQQTRVVQGLPYYQKFIDSFPTVSDLANAQEQEVLVLWQGLGYYSRARNLHAAAKMVLSEFDGVFPTDYQNLKKLKGVGDYTASAVSSFCAQEPQAVLDGNVFRVLARYFNIDLAINSTPGQKYFKQLALDLLDKDQPGKHNQAIMEFGALQCTPKSPDCNNCPLNTSCLAIKHGKTDQLPVKHKAKPARMRFFNYLVKLDPDNNTQIQKREGPGIWQNLYEFPLWESDAAIDTHEVETYLNTHVTDKFVNLSRFNDKPKIHKLSHQHLYATFWILEIEKPITDPIAWQDLDKYPMPVLLTDFIKAFKI